MVEFIPRKKVKGSVAGLFVARGKSFLTEAVDFLALTYEGIPWILSH
jgi:hypothetical protein